MSAISHHFTVQIKILSRKLEDFGINPLLALILYIFLLFIISFTLFYKTSYAPYIIVVMGLSIILPLSNGSRNDFLLSIFYRAKWKEIRIYENLLIISPFVSILMFKSHFIGVITLFMLTVFLAIQKSLYQTQITIPTPFGKTPFEFVIGFRKAYIAIIFFYFLSTMAIFHDNFNLGVFSLALTILTSLAFYNLIEPPFYLTMYKLDPRSFLFHKIKTAIIQLFILILPMMVALGISFYTQFHFLLLFTLLGFVYLTMMILAKYSSYPKEIGLPMAIALALNMVFPFFMIITLPVLYNKSLKKLQFYLS